MRVNRYMDGLNRPYRAVLFSSTGHSFGCSAGDVTVIRFTSDVRSTMSPAALVPPIIVGWQYFIEALLRNRLALGSAMVDGVMHDAREAALLIVRACLEYGLAGIQCGREICCGYVNSPNFTTTVSATTATDPGAGQAGISWIVAMLSGMAFKGTALAPVRPISFK
jgi:hypothetical protein